MRGKGIKVAELYYYDLTQPFQLLARSHPIQILTYLNDISFFIYCNG